MRDHAWLRGDFYGRAVRAIAETRPDVVGFTSMAVESHVCLELARRLKQADAGVVTVLGGPHFTSIAREVLELYPWIDFVVMGEGEAATRSLAGSLRGTSGMASITNVARRATGNGQVTFTRRLKPEASLDDLPFPAYHLVDLEDYFAVNPSRLLCYEHGRGCIFCCSFCYSPVQWGQGGQAKGIERVVGEVARLRDLGARHLFFVQDNFLNNVAAAKALCRALAEARTGVTWNCYATLPQLTPDVLDLLADAGCTEVFVGVDAVSPGAQRSFAKHFFKGWAPLEARLRACLDRGIGVTCAFMIDSPEEGHADTDAALITAVLTSALGCFFRLNTLTLYNGTASFLAMQDRPKAYTEVKPRLLLDTAPVVQDNPYAREWPELFPFHYTFMPVPLYHRFSTAMLIAFHLFLAFPQTLAQYALTDSGSLWQLLDGLVARVGDLGLVHPPQR